MTETPTATATETATPSPSPTPVSGENVEFNFEEGEDGWQAGSLPGFDPGTTGTTGGGIGITANGNTNSFTSWQSPEIEIVDGSSTETLVGRSNTAIRGLTGEDSLYRTTFVVSTSVADQSLVPTLRVRSSSADYQQSDVIVATSVGDGAYSPATGGTTYVQYFTQPAGQNRFRLNFDLLNFDPTDAANGDLILQSVVIEAFDRANLAGEQAVASFNFANDANGFTFRGAGLEEPAAEVTARGLQLVGSADAASTVFGYWGIDTAVPFVAGRLYQVAFSVSTPAPAARRTEVPTFRLRYNDSSLQASGYINIESVNEAARTPVDNEPKRYFLFIATPPQVVGNTWIFSFDYLHVPGAGDNNDPTIPVTLENLEVKSYDIP